MERVLGLFFGFEIAGQVEDFRLMLYDKSPAQRDNTRWLIVFDSLATSCSATMP